MFCKSCYNLRDYEAKGQILSPCDDRTFRRRLMADQVNEYLQTAEKLRGKHIRTLETMNQVISENATMKAQLAKLLGG